jgi:5-methylcytosine-specific restriction protein A
MTAAYRTCCEPGCPEVTIGRSRCKRHDRPGARARGYGHKWESTRARFLKRWPDCQQPGCTDPATDVHHLDGHGPNGPRGHDQTNLKSLCHSCHSQITGKGGGGPVTENPVRDRPPVDTKSYTLGGG